MKLNLFFVFLVFFKYTQAAVLNLKATYSIPIVAAESSELNKFELNNYSVLTDENKEQIEFELPSEMTGMPDQKILLKMIGKTGPTTRVLSGVKGKAVCNGPWAEMQCSIAFKDVKFDLKKLKKIISQQAPSQDSEQKMIMLARFAADPIGTFSTK